MSDEEKRRWKGPTGKEGSSGRQMNERKIRAHNAKTDSSKQWLERQMSDPYVRKAKLEGFRAHIVQGDVNEPGDVARMMKGLTGKPNLVLSDMAANTTGHKQTDHLRTVALVEMAAAFAVEHLAPGGAFCSKVFQGGTTKEVLELLKANFTTVKHIKPPASRAGSPEIFVVAKGFKG